MEVYLIRHTQPNVGKGIAYGQADLELVETFPKELAQLKEKLPASPESTFDAFYSSPLQRCHLLAKSLTNNAIILDKRLMELNFGDWEMQAWGEIPKEKLDVWMEDFVNRSAPNGETMLVLQERVLEWWEELQQKNHRMVAVTTHAGVIRVLLSHLRKIPLEKVFSEISLEYGDVVHLEE